MEYPWYSILHNSVDIQQGDLIPNCPIVIPPSTSTINEEIEISIQQIDSIILSQSCDLLHDKIEIVLVCPYYPLRTFVDALSESERTTNGKKKAIENLKKGFLPGYHLIEKYETHIEDYQVVDFRNVYGIQIGALKKICESTATRIRLLPPYREHLSQAFARYFMRVGLPQDIIIDEKY